MTKINCEWKNKRRKKGNKEEEESTQLLRGTLKKICISSSINRWAILLIMMYMMPTNPIKSQS